MKTQSSCWEADCERGSNQVYKATRCRTVKYWFMSAQRVVCESQFLIACFLNYITRVCLEVYKLRGVVEENVGFEHGQQHAAACFSCQEHVCQLLAGSPAEHRSMAFLTLI
jgi:hypothetical protein